MNKYIIVAVVIVLTGFAISFLFRSSDSINQNLADLGNNLTTPVSQTGTGGEKTGVASQNPEKQITSNNKEIEKIMNATLHTNKGEITIEFFSNDAPKTVDNFLKLAKDGFYNGVKFHRVIKGFMIQGGDPLSKDNSKMALWGTGGPGYSFADEINQNSDLYKKGYQKGIMAMANSGPNTNGSQFFIMTENYPLPPLYTIFGKVVSGQDVVDKIANVKTNSNDRPLEPVVVNSITLK